VNNELRRIVIDNNAVNAFGNFFTGFARIGKFSHRSSGQFFWVVVYGVLAAFLK
jgi:hypothetical protein